MDDFMLINELVDSDDDMHMEVDLLFDDVSAQQAAMLLIFENEVAGIDLSRSVPDKHLDEDGNSKEETLPPSSNNFAMDAEMLGDFHLIGNIAVSYSEEDFVKIFRVKPSLAEHITFLCRSSASYSDVEVLPEQQTRAVLFYLGHEKVAIEDVCDRFKINFSTFDQILFRVTSAVCSLSHTVICWPSDHQKEITKTFYAQKTGLQGVLGCIDTLPVKVSKREEKSAVSSRVLLILQAAVNEKKNFSHIHVSNMAHTDDEILKTSKFYDEIASRCSGKEYFVAGPTYVGRQYLLTPYPHTGKISGDHIFLNLSLAACMSSAVAAFSRLKQRFGSLQDLQLPNTAIAHQVISACCILHNMADKEDFNEPFDERELEIQGYSRVNSQTFGAAYVAGLSLRKEVCKQLV